MSQAVTPVASSALTGIVAMTKAKLNAVASVAAKAALRRLVAIVGTPSCEGWAEVPFPCDGHQIVALGARV